MEHRGMGQRAPRTHAQRPQNESIPEVPPLPSSFETFSISRRSTPNLGRRRSTPVSASVDRSVRQVSSGFRHAPGSTDTFTLRLLFLSPLLIATLLLLATLCFQPMLVRDPASFADDDVLTEIYEKVDALSQDTAKTFEAQLAEYRKEVDSSNEHNTERLLTRINGELATVSLETSRFLQEQQSRLSDEIKTLFDNALKGLRTKYDEEIAALDRQFTRKIHASQSERKNELTTLALDLTKRFQNQNFQQTGICDQSTDVTAIKARKRRPQTEAKCRKDLSYKEEYKVFGKILNATQSVFDGWTEGHQRMELWNFEQYYYKRFPEVACIEEHLRIYANLGSESLSTAIPSTKNEIESSLLMYKDQLNKILDQAQYAIGVTERLLSKKDDMITMIRERDERFTSRRFAFRYTCLREPSEDAELSASCKGLDELYAATDCFEGRFVSRKGWLKDVRQRADKVSSVLEHTLNDLTKYGQSGDSFTTETIRQLTEPFTRAMQTLKEKMESRP